MENRSTFWPKKWSRSLTEGVRLQEVPTVMFLLCLDWRSLMGGGHTWRFDCTSWS